MPASAAAWSAGTFDAVLIVPGDGPARGDVRRAGDQIPESLRDFVKAGQVSYQYATVHTDGFTGRALIIGSPTTGPVSNLELYLIYPLSSEESTIALVRGTMLTGGSVLLVLLAAIAVVVSRQVVQPVRSASRIAERFADGHLTERMPVRGEDDMARLAMSFNDMAESLSRQITQLEEFGNLQRRFTSDVSHELRTPLTTVRMAADLIYDHSEDLDPSLRRSTELMVSELDRFETLLNDLLEISRHDAGVAELSVEQLDLRSTVRSALENVGHLADDAGVDVDVQLPDARGDRRGRPPSRRADPAQPDRQRHRPRRAQAGRRSGWPPTRTPSPSPSATSGSACARARRSWCSAGSGGPIRRGCGVPAAPGWGWRSASRTRGCTRAGWRRGASPARAPASG